jgi:hypothetical protein
LPAPAHSPPEKLSDCDLEILQPTSRRLAESVEERLWRANSTPLSFRREAEQ